MAGLIRVPAVTILMAGLLNAVVALAEPIGLWNTEGDEGQVEISLCGEKLCGDLVWLAEPTDQSGQPVMDQYNPDESLRSRPVQGMRILWDMQPSGDDKTWKDGKVYDPETGKTYQGRLTLDSPDVLRLRGFVGAPMFGRTSTWTRAEQPESAPQQ